MREDGRTPRCGTRLAAAWAERARNKQRRQHGRALPGGPAGGDGQDGRGTYRCRGAAAKFGHEILVVSNEE